MLCKKCKRKINNVTEIRIFFDIHNPTTMEVECKNNYESLSMADTINFRKALHQALDKSLDEIAVKLFCQKTGGKENGRTKV